MFERSPTATIKVKKAEKSLLDVSNSSAATDGSVKKLLQFFEYEFLNMINEKY